MIKTYDMETIGDKDYADIAKHLKSSGLIIYPTETSYAIGADALNNSAVRKVFRLKNRDADKPFPILVKDLNMLIGLASVNRREEDIISKFWPGVLTILFKSKKMPKKYLFTADSEFIGARISPHPFALRLFEEIDFPITATSANLSGKGGISDFDALLKNKFFTLLTSDKEDIILINGKKLPGGASTIIKVARKKIEIVREGDNNIKERLICSIKNDGNCHNAL